MEAEWLCFREGVLKCAKEVCVMRRMGGSKRKGSEWWDEEMRMAVGEKRWAYEEWLQRGTVEAYERYKRKRVEVKWKVRAAKRRADLRWGESLSENFDRNKMFWKEVKRVRGGQSGGKERVKGADGQLLVDEREVR